MSKHTSRSKHVRKKENVTGKGTPAIGIGMDAGKIHAIGPTTKKTKENGTILGHPKVVTSGNEREEDGMSTFGDVPRAKNALGTL